MRLGSCKSRDVIYASVNCRSDLSNRSKIKGRWNVQCFDPEGHVKWEDKIENLVVNQGLDYLLDVALASGTQYNFWYVGLVDTFTYPSGAPADTMSSHASWTELYTEYDETTRPWWEYGAVASQSVSNTANKATFSINTNGTTIEGAFLSSDGTKNGSTGQLYAVGVFTGGTKSADSGDSLQVTATFTSADDGA